MKKEELIAKGLTEGRHGYLYRGDEGIYPEVSL